MARIIAGTQHRYVAMVVSIARTITSPSRRRPPYCRCHPPICADRGRIRTMTCSNCGVIVMADQQLAIQAVSDAQRILEEYLEPRPHNNERILDKLVEVLGRPDLVVAVGRLQRSNGW